jgi:two-component system heavy metal sensor histidine kinase CusS
LSRSLAFKLTLSYLLAAGLVFLASSLGLYAALAFNVAQMEQRLLDEKVSLFIEDQAREPGDTAELFGQLSSGVGDGQHPEYWVRLLDRAGKTLLETPGMAVELAPERFPLPALTASDQAPLRVRSAGGRALRLRSAWSLGGGAQQKMIQVGLDCQRDRRLLQDFRFWLALIDVLGLLALGGLSLALARRGLRPLDELGRVIGGLSAQSLSVPLDPQRWPRETRALVGGFNGLSARLHASFLRLSQFSADLAHELRTPIHNLSLQADVILARPRKGPEYKQALEAAQEEYARLTRMAESLLFLARAENGKQALEWSTCDAREALEAAERQFRALAAEKRLKLSVQGRGRLRADAGLLQLALGNLLANACAHSPRGGGIILRAEALEGGGLRLSVRDHGPGIPVSERPRVFDRFFRGDPARAQGEGSGLGLAIVAAIMDLHQGRASIASPRGRGAQVQLDFPASSPL